MKPALLDVNLLIALAARHGGRLVTLDRGLRALVAEGTSADQAIEVVRV